MALSRRFSSIKPVGISSSEAEDTEDDDEIRLRLFGKTNRFKYSNPAKISFECDRIGGSTSTSDDEDEDLLGDMDASWMEEFRDIMGRSSKEKEAPEQQSLLCEKTVHEVYHEPLDTLKESLEKYNQHYQDKEAQVVPNISPQIHQDTTTPCGDAARITRLESPVRAQNITAVSAGSISNNQVEKKHCDSDLDRKHKSKSHISVNETESSSNSTSKVGVSKKSDHIILKEDSKCLVETPTNTNSCDNHKTESNKSRDAKQIEECKRRKSVLSKDNSDHKKKVSGKSGKVAHIHSTKTEIKKVSNEEYSNKDSKEATSSDVDEKSNKAIRESSEKGHKSLSSVQHDNHVNTLSDSETKLKQKETSHSKKNSNKDTKERSKPVNLHDPTNKHEVKKPKTYHITPASSFPLDELLPTMSLKSKKASTDITDKQALPNLQNKTTDEHEYLSKDKNLEPSFDDNSLWNATLMNEQEQWHPWSNTSQPTIQEGVFHGTLFKPSTPCFQTTQNPVYQAEAESYPAYQTIPQPIEILTQNPVGLYEEESVYPTYQTNPPVQETSQTPLTLNPVYPCETESVYPTYQTNPITPETSQVPLTMSQFVSDNLSDIMLAIQNGNTSILASLQEALYQEIGTNLQALAAKTKQQKRTTKPDQSEAVDKFGFYQEQRPSASVVHCDGTGSGSSMMEQQPQGETDQSEQLFHLFVQQCQGLVQTDQDKEKLETLVKLLKTEAGDSLTSTGFTPPDVDHVNDPLKEDMVKEATADKEALTECSASPKSTTGTNVIGLFEGRTLLKGGVNPRHIPKTVTVKKSQRPTDPRIPNIDKLPIELKLPPFLKELWGQDKYDKIIALCEVSHPVDRIVDRKSRDNNNDFYNPSEALMKNKDVKDINKSTRKGNLGTACDHEKSQNKIDSKKVTVEKSSKQLITAHANTDKLTVKGGTNSVCGSEKSQNKINSKKVIVEKSSKQVKTTHVNTDKLTVKVGTKSVCGHVGTGNGNSKKRTVEKSSSIEKTNAAFEKAKVDKISKSDDQASKCTSKIEKSKPAHQSNKDLNTKLDKSNSKHYETVESSNKKKCGRSVASEKFKVGETKPSDSKVDVPKTRPRQLSPTGTDRNVVSMELDSDSETSSSESYWRDKITYRESTSKHSSRKHKTVGYSETVTPTYTDTSYDRAHGYKYYSTESTDRHSQHTVAKRGSDEMADYTRYDMSCTNRIGDSNEVYTGRRYSSSSSSSRYSSTSRYNDTDGVVSIDSEERGISYKLDRESVRKHHTRWDNESRERKRNSTVQDSHTIDYNTDGPKESVVSMDSEERGISYKLDRESVRKRHTRWDSESRERKRHNTVQDSHTSDYKKRRYEYGSEETRRRSYGDTRPPDLSWDASKYRTNSTTGNRESVGSYMDTFSPTMESPNAFTVSEKQAVKSKSISNAKSIISFKINQSKVKKSPTLPQGSHDPSHKSYSPQYGTKITGKDCSNSDSASVFGKKNVKVTCLSESIKIADKNNSKEKLNVAQEKNTDSSKVAVNKTVSRQQKAKKSLEEDREFLQNLKKRLSGEMEPVKQ